MDYVGGYVIFNDITARDIQRREMRSGVFSFCKAIDTFCPLGPWIVTPDEIPDPHDLAMELRVNGETRQTSHSGRMSVDDPGDPVALLGARLLGRRRALDRDRERRGRVLRGRRLALPEAGRRDRGRDRADRRPAQPGDRLAGGARRAAAGARRAAGEVGSVELVPLVDAVGELGELAELFPEPRRLGAVPRALSGALRGLAWRVPCTSYLFAPAATPCSSTPASARPASGAGAPELEEGLLPALAEAGVAPEDVDVVFLTHLHVDHVGWNTDRDGRLVFPNARYVTHGDGIAFARASGRPHIERTILAVEFEEIDGAADIAEGVTAFPLPGHFPGHMGLRIDSDGERAILIADAAVHPMLLETRTGSTPPTATRPRARRRGAASVRSSSTRTSSPSAATIRRRHRPRRHPRRPGRVGAGGVRASLCFETQAPLASRNHAGSSGANTRLCFRNTKSPGRAHELAAGRREARPRAGADGRAGARRARRPRARQRPLPDELLGHEGVRRRRLPAGGRSGAGLPRGLRGRRGADGLDERGAALPRLRRERPTAAGPAGARPRAPALVGVRPGRDRAQPRHAGGRPDGRRADDVPEGVVRRFPETQPTRRRCSPPPARSRPSRRSSGCGSRTRSRPRRWSTSRAGCGPG